MADKIFWSLITSIGSGLFAMMLTRITAIAGARRAGYAPVAAKLVELWRAGDPKKHELFVELTKLVIDGNRDLYPAIETFVDAINNIRPDAETQFLKLLDKMRSTSALAEVRESFFSSGPSRADLFKKLLVK